MNPLEIGDNSKQDRERTYKYAHINLILYPEYYIVRSGTTSMIYTNRDRKIGELFLYWDNKEVMLNGNKNELKPVVERLQENGYTVKWWGEWAKC